MKIGIGTVTFGTDYGISNLNGQTSSLEVNKILNLAKIHGITYLDTAPGYGTSEEVLGENLPKDNQFHIVTKTPTFPSSKFIEKKQLTKFSNSFQKSLDLLNGNVVYGLLIHHVEDLLKPGGTKLFKQLKYYKDQGLVKKIGVSIYTAEQIDMVLRDFDIDLIQVPVNVFDQRLLQSGHLEQLHKKQIEIHTRSPFLQGLLLMDLKLIPNYFHPIYSHLEKFHLFLKYHQFTPIQAALGFVTNLREVDVVLCGIENSNQLLELIQTPQTPSSIDWEPFGFEDQHMINPSLWKL